MGQWSKLGARLEGGTMRHDSASAALRPKQSEIESRGGDEDSRALARGGVSGG